MRTSDEADGRRDPPCRVRGSRPPGAAPRAPRVRDLLSRRASQRRRMARDADLLIVLGGPIGVADTDAYPFLREELELIGERLAGDRPTLGICLGAQLLAVAAGGSVRPGTEAEIGYAPVTLTTAAPGSVLEPLRGVPVLHWHGDVISTPPELPPLAFTQLCANQAFARG